MGRGGGRLTALRNGLPRRVGGDRLILTPAGAWRKNGAVGECLSGIVTGPASRARNNFA